MADKYKVQVDNRGFFDEDNDEVDDFTFVSHPQQGSRGYLFGERNYDPSEVDTKAKKQQQLMEEIEKIQRRTLESSERSVGLVHESEQVGIETAQDLLHQREQLENCDDKVSDINRSLRASQKHLNSIKSVFYGFRNMFSKTPPQPSTTAEEQPKPKSSVGLGPLLEQRPEVARKTEEHPALRLKGVNYMEDSSAAPAPLYTNYDIERKLDENLSDISLGIDRLKGLALGLGEEIEDQNVMLDRLTSGVDKAEGTVKRQTKQIEKQLKS